MPGSCSPPHLVQFYIQNAVDWSDEITSKPLAAQESEICIPSFPFTAVEKSHWKQTQLDIVRIHQRNYLRHNTLCGKICGDKLKVFNSYGATHIFCFTLCQFCCICSFWDLFMSSKLLNLLASFDYNQANARCPPQINKLCSP